VLEGKGIDMHILGVGDVSHCSFAFGKTRLDELISRKAIHQIILSEWLSILEKPAIISGSQNDTYCLLPGGEVIHIVLVVNAQARDLLGPGVKEVARRIPLVA